MITKIGRISDEELTNFRRSNSQELAVKANPAAYSASETERIFFDNVRFVGNLLSKYKVDSTKDWQLSSYSGDFWYVD